MISQQLRQEIEADNTLNLVRHSTVSTLLLHGDADTLIPVDPARRIADCRDTLRTVIYPGAQHGLESVRTQATATIITWLSSNATN